MKTKFYTLIFTLILSWFLANPLLAQNLPFSKIQVTIAPELQATFTKGGRLFLHLSSTNEREPRFRPELSIATTPDNWDATQTFVLDSKAKSTKYKGLDKWIPGRTYYYQLVYKQNTDDGQENVPGNIYSKVDSLIFSNKTKLNLPITQLMVQEEVIKHSHVKTVTIKSELLKSSRGKSVT